MDEPNAMRRCVSLGVRQRHGLVSQVKGHALTGDRQAQLHMRPRYATAFLFWIVQEVLQGFAIGRFVDVVPKRPILFESSTSKIMILIF